MARYSAAHRQRTRARILDEAARAFRADGFAAVSIPDLMGRAGLTHGGFYAHFASKDALAADACAHALAETVERLLARPTPDGPATAASVIAAYLSPRHRDRPAEGCLLPALAGEVARAAPPVRRAFTAGLADYLTRLAALLPPDGPAARPDAALALASGLVGALLLARAVDDPALSERILAAGRAFLTETFAAAPQPIEPA